MAIQNINFNPKPEKGISYSVITDTSADWAGIANDTYFYNLDDDLPYYKDSSGDVIAVFEKGGVTDNIYTADGTIGSGRIATLTDTLTFDCLDQTNGGVIIDGTSYTGNQEPVFQVLGTGSSVFKIDEKGFITNTEIDDNNLLKLRRTGGTYHLRHEGGSFSVKANDYKFYYPTNINTYLQLEPNRPTLKWVLSSNTIHEIMGEFDTNFYMNGFGASQWLTIGSSSRIGTEDISLQGETLINDYLIQKAETTAIADGTLVDDSFSFHIDSGELKGRYKDNLGVVTDLTIGAVTGGLISVNDSSGIPTFYSDLQTAVNDAGANGVVYLHSDITQTTTVTLPAGANTSFTINGNGHKITHTSDTGTEYALFFVGSGNNKKFYLNNIKIESNGTSVSTSTGAVFRANPGGGSMELFFDDNTYITSVNNAIIYLLNCNGGILESTNSYVNFAGFNQRVKNAKVITKFGRSNFINCDITVTTGGQVGSQAVEIRGCTITGDAVSNTMISIRRNCKFWDNTYICTSGANAAMAIGSGASGNFINIQNVKGYHYGTGIAMNGAYIKDIHNCYFYSEGGTALYTLRTQNSQSGYNIKDVTCVTNATNQPAFYDQQGSSITAFRIKGLTAVCKNASNTSPAMQIQIRSSDGDMYMTDCEAIVTNPSVKNIVFSDSGTVYMYNVLAGEVGTGIDFGTVTLGNTNTLDAYGNGQIG